MELWRKQLVGFPLASGPLGYLHLIPGAPPIEGFYITVIILAVLLTILAKSLTGVDVRQQRHLWVDEVSQNFFPGSKYSNL